MPDIEMKFWPTNVPQHQRRPTLIVPVDVLAELVTATAPGIVGMNILEALADAAAASDQVSAKEKPVIAAWRRALQDYRVNG